MAPAQCAEAYARVTQACAEIGRDPSEITWSAVATLCFGRTAQEIATRTETLAARLGGDPTDIVRNGLTGGSAEVLDRLAEFRAAGADRVYLQKFDLSDLEQLELFAEEVLPFLPQDTLSANPVG